MKYRNIIKIKAMALFMLTATCLFAQKGPVMSGKIYNSVSGKPVDFATITVLEDRVKARTGPKGTYSVAVSKGGTYTVIVRSQGLKILSTKMTIRKSLKRDFYLRPMTINVSGITVTDDKYFQKVSRRKMSREDMKATPASLGDAISALASLPGIERTGGFFGPLVIRGMYDLYNRYYIDGMPISDPMHFGGLHSVINTNLIDEINLYSSSFPARYGGAMAAVIDITTIDNVKKEGGYVDTGLISTNFLYKRPFISKMLDPSGNEKKENTGYVIASGRYGYLGFLIPWLYEQIKDEESVIVPEYYDYQIKLKKVINSRHSFSMLFIGSKDYFKLQSKEDTFDETADPLLNDLEMQQEQMFHNLGLYHTYRNGRIKNKLMTYASITQYDLYVDSSKLPAETPDWMEDLNQKSKPHIYGIKNTTDLEWIKNHADLKIELEYTYYDFKAKGETITTATGNTANLDDVYKIPLEVSSTNQAIGGYLENRFVIGGLTFVPGVRSDYLKRTEKATLDPRAMLSYEFNTGTTISLASGKYSSFFQLNPYLFNYRPDMAVMDEEAIEKAYHNVLGIEQTYGLYTVGVEGYYNYFKNLGVEYPHYEDGEFLEGQMSGENKVYGFEIMLRKDREKGKRGFFGWLSYTYSVSKFKSGVTGYAYDATGNPTSELYDECGDEWINSEFDRRHSVKLVLGYTFDKITLSGKFQYLSSYPYTSIIGSEEDANYPGRHTPIYDIYNKNSERYSAYHRLDLRFEYKTNYEFGHVSWYVEIINVYAKTEETQTWKYNQPFSSSNPVIEANDGLSIVPNFGVEIKF